MSISFKPRLDSATVDASALKKVRAAIHRVKPELAKGRITPAASLVSDLGVDSLALAQLSIALEDEFGRPVFVGDLLADIDDPATITVGQLVEHMAGNGQTAS